MRPRSSSPSPDVLPLDAQVRALWQTLRTLVAEAPAPSLATVREPAVAAIRYLETELQRALAGATLRGLPNLGSTDWPLHGVRLRGRADTSLPRLERGEKATAWTLFLSEKGELDQVRAERVGTTPDFELVVRDTPDDALVVEDLPAFVTLLGLVLARHAELTKDRTMWVDGLRVLSEQARRLKLGA